MNYSLREHKNLVGKTVVSGHLSMHCRSCDCELVYGECSVIKKEKDKLIREVIEAYKIYRDEDNCGSTLSVSLSKKEIEYLDVAM